MTAAHRSQAVDYTPGRGLPLGVPPGSAADDLSEQVSAEFGPFREPNTSAKLQPEDHPAAGDRRRIGHRQLAQIIEQLSDRDSRVLHLIAEHRFLTTYQLQQFCFLDHQTSATGARVTRRVVGRLQRDGLVVSLDRRVGGHRAGSAATIWRLTSAGQRVVDRNHNRRRLGNPSERFLRHCLAVADVHVLLEHHRRIEPIEEVRVEVEPASWRTYRGRGGERRWLQPDLYTEIISPAFIDRVFIEVDLGTESLPALLRKCQQYEEYRSSGIEQGRLGSFPLVTWLLLTTERAEHLASAVKRRSTLTQAMYRFATPDTLPQILAGGEA